MDFLYLAEAASEQTQGGTMGTVVMLGFWVIVIVVLYFIMFRPQRKRQQEEEALRNSVEVLSVELLRYVTMTKLL